MKARGHDGEASGPDNGLGSIGRDQGDFAIEYDMAARSARSVLRLVDHGGLASNVNAAQITSVRVASETPPRCRTSRVI